MVFINRTMLRFEIVQSQPNTKGKVENLEVIELERDNYVILLFNEETYVHCRHFSYRCMLKNI